MHFQKHFFFLPILVALLASCSKEPETGVAEGEYTGAKLVAFNNYAGYTVYNAVLANKLDTANFQLKLSNTMGTASRPITVTLVRDNTSISEYNTVNGTSLVPVPNANIDLLTTTVTFQPGQRVATFSIIFNSTRLGGGNALGLAIAKVEGDGAAVINDVKQNRLVIEMVAVNEWDGAYKSSSGYFYHPTAPRDIPAGTDKFCYTSGVNTVVTELGDFNGVLQGATVYYVTLTINASNSVTISPGPGAAPAVNPVVTLSSLPSPYTPFTGSNPSTYSNKWDPATKKFYLRYGYMGANGYRVIEEVLTKQ